MPCFDAFVRNDRAIEDCADDVMRMIAALRAGEPLAGDPLSVAKTLRKAAEEKNKE